MPQWGQIVFEVIFLFSLANMAAFGSQFTQPIDRVVNEQMDFRMQFFIKVRGMVTYISLKPYMPTTILSMPQ